MRSPITARDRTAWLRDRLTMLLPYTVAVISIPVATLLLGLTALLLHLTRIETYPLVYLSFIALIAWRFGRGPALAATITAALAMDSVMVPPDFTLGWHQANDMIRLVTGVIAAVVIVEIIQATRTSRSLLERRKDLLQEVSPRIIQSLDEEEIMATVAEQTRRVIDYQHFRLYRWEEATERLVLVKSVARADPYAGVDWRSVTLALGEGITGTAAMTRRPILVPDARRDPRIVYPPGVAPLEESMLSVPVVTRDRLFGVLSLGRLGVRSLTRDDLRLMESIAAQTALALANAEQYAEAEQTIHALAAIEALQPSTTGLSEAEVDQRITSSFLELSQADMATLRIVRGDGRYHVGAMAGDVETSPEAPIQATLGPADVAWLLDGRTAAYVTDTQTDPRLPAWAQESARRSGVHASVYLPLRAGQQMVGFMGLHWRRPRWLRAEQLGRFQLVAAQAAITVDTRRALELERGRAEALAELERARREFMQIASHELRTPLTVIRGYASLLEDGSLGVMPEKAQRALRTLMDKSTEMRVQVERMLLLGRLEDGATPPPMHPLDLRLVVQDSIDRVRPQVELKGGKVVAHLADDPLTVTGDADRLTTAVDNLLQNAVKFSVAPPRIEVVADLKDGQIRLVVHDEGVGIAPEALGRLFEKFYRVNDPRLRNVAGTGIGLYLVRQVIEGHGGQVDVESAVGAGTTFTLRLPQTAPVGAGRGVGAG
ncbi:MAG TPA: GAF domain-containing protein [Candidatus Dormibacteraeota bacterium]|jgi:signal transduction histidine kinase/putative methionine-R-sulfoxide reductase with GAF domain